MNGPLRPVHVAAHTRRVAGRRVPVREHIRQIPLVTVAVPHPRGRHVSPDQLELPMPVKVTVAVAMKAS